MERVFYPVVAGIMVLLVPTGQVFGVTVTQLFGPGDFLSSTTVSVNFENGVVDTPPANTPDFTFESTAIIGNSLLWNDNGTSSGTKGLVESMANEPMRIVFTTPVNEVGLFFGNDDFGLRYNANLELFDVGNNSLGLIRVACNANDAADQYLGARSDILVKSVAIYYDRPAAQQLSVYIDDLKVGIIPEPSSLLLLLLGVLGLGIRRVLAQAK